MKTTTLCTRVMTPLVRKRIHSAMYLVAATLLFMMLFAVAAAKAGELELSPIYNHQTADQVDTGKRPQEPAPEPTAEPTYEPYNPC